VVPRSSLILKKLWTELTMLINEYSKKKNTNDLLPKMKRFTKFCSADEFPVGLI